MSFYNEFPNTNYYEQDLGFLIKKYKELNNNYELLVQIYENVKQNIKDITLNQLEQWLDDGTLENLINKALFNEKISYFTTTISMIKNEDIKTGTFVKTLGYNSINDSGDGYFLIVDVIDEENDIFIKLNNNLYGKLIFQKTLNVKALGIGTENRDISNDLKNLLKKVENNLTLYFPKGRYLINSTLVINKCVNFLGIPSNSPWEENYSGSYFVTDSLGQNSTLLNINTSNILIKNIAFKNETENLVNGIINTPDMKPANVNMNIRIDNCFFYGLYNGINYQRVITSNINNCYFKKCYYGINLNGDINTSISMRDCWVFENIESSYVIENSNYIECNNCCTDTTSYGFFIKNSLGVSLNACATEVSINNPIYIESSQGVSIISFFSTGCNTSSVNNISFLSAISNSNVSLINCVEHSPSRITLGVYYDESSHVSIINSTIVGTVTSTKGNGFIDEYLLPQLGFFENNEKGSFISIEQSNGYTAPGDVSMTWFVFLVKNDGTTYQNLQIGGRVCVNQGVTVNGFAIRVS